MEIVIIAHNIRSAHNIGSIFRTADGAGVKKIYLTGYSPSPAKKNTPYLTKAQKMISKTALGAEEIIPWKKFSSIGKLLENLKEKDFEIVALEQDKNSLNYLDFKTSSSIALILGNEPRGIDKRVLKKCDAIIEIPMKGKKKSLNVSVAFGIAIYQICSKL